MCVGWVCHVRTCLVRAKHVLGDGHSSAVVFLAQRALDSIHVEELLLRQLLYAVLRGHDFIHQLWVGRWSGVGWVGGSDSESPKVARGEEQSQDTKTKGEPQFRLKTKQRVPQNDDVDMMKKEPWGNERRCEAR